MPKNKLQDVVFTVARWCGLYSAISSGKSKSLTNPFKCAILLKDTKKTKKVQALRRR